MAYAYRISPAFWPDVRGLPRDVKLVALYLLTCSHRNLEGLYYLPPEYAAADIGMTVNAVEQAFTKLEERGMIAYDGQARVVFVRNALRYQSPSTPKQIQGAIAALSRVPPSSLWDEFRMACESHCPPLAEAIATGHERLAV